jgi:2,5-dihydroxypyridine 5,6-dioxygenase
MLQETIEGKWVKAFVEVFRLCAVKKGEVVAILSESQSRPVLPRLSELALHQLEARPFQVLLSSPEIASPVPIRSTGTSLAIGGLAPVVKALASSNMVVDCTVEGLLHSRELPEILKGGARVLMISNEHPEVLERTRPTPELRTRVRRGMELLGNAKWMRVTSDAGTDLTVNVEGAPARGATGFVDEPGRIGYWPAGLCLCFPKPGSVNGRLVLAPGDVNLTFKRYIESPVEFTIENDYVTRIGGNGLDAELTRSYYEAWNDREAYATSHVGWGMNLGARWDAMVMYDKAQHNGTELRAFAGNFLFSTGANETAGRFTPCHFDFPMRNCTVELDGKLIVDRGRLCDELRN